jgi:DNA-binding response OmpR family regulator
MVYYAGNSVKRDEKGRKSSKSEEQSRLFVGYPTMLANILIVEDEVLVALEMQSILEQQGHRVAGIAVDLESALAYVDQPIDLALVDLNLRDGLTGPEIGRRLANDHRAGVLFVTANPAMLGDGIAGTIGVLTKPTDETTLSSAVSFALRHLKGEMAEAPAALRRFS